MLHEIITTEKVPFTYRVAGLGSRFLAWLVDALVIVLLGFSGLMAVAMLEGIRPGLGLALSALWIFFLLVGYFLLFEWLWYGQTPGKRVLGIRVIQWQGTQVSFVQSAVRNLLRFVDSLPAFYGAACAVAACNRESRRLGDLAAGTLVVHVDRKSRLILSLYDDQSKQGASTAAQARQRLLQMDRPRKETLLDLCLRREQLQVTDRAQLFAAVAEYLKGPLGLEQKEYESDEKFVLRAAVELGPPVGAQVTRAGGDSPLSRPPPTRG